MNPTKNFGSGLDPTFGKVQEAGERIGIRFQVQDRKGGGFRSKLPAISRPSVNVTRPSIRSVYVKPLSLSLPDFSHLQTRRAAQQQQIHQIRQNTGGFI